MCIYIYTHKYGHKNIDPRGFLRDWMGTKRQEGRSCCLLRRANKGPLHAWSPLTVQPCFWPQYPLTPQAPTLVNVQPELVTTLPKPQPSRGLHLPIQAAARCLEGSPQSPITAHPRTLSGNPAPPTNLWAPRAGVFHFELLGHSTASAPADDPRAELRLHGTWANVTTELDPNLFCHF